MFLGSFTSIGAFFKVKKPQIPGGRGLRSLEDAGSEYHLSSILDRLRCISSSLYLYLYLYLYSGLPCGSVNLFFTRPLQPFDDPDFPKG